MERDQIMQSLFGYQSEEEDASTEKELIISDGGREPDNKGKGKSEGETKVNRTVDRKGPHLGSSRSPASEKRKTAAEVIRDVFGDSDDEPAEYANYSPTNEKNARSSPEYKGNIVPNEDATDKCDEEGTQAKLKRNKGVIEIPSRPPLGRQDQKVTIKLANIIGIAKEPFDPETYVEEDIYKTDATGFKRCMTPGNMIRWRKVNNPDGTSSVESNARFVEWKDGSTQLLIGNEAFDVSEQEVKDIQSHIFMKHKKGIYEAQGKVSKNMKFMPSSLSSNSHRCLTALVDSMHKKVNKVKEYITDVDPERIIDQNEKLERQRIKATKQLNNKKKKVTDKYSPKGYKETQLTSGFLDEDEEQDDDLDLEMEAASEKRIMNAKKVPKYTRNSSPSNVKLDGNEVEEMQEGEEEEFYEDSEVEAEMGSSKAKGKKSGRRLIKKYIDSDEDAPQRITATTRRKNAIIYDSDDE
ncbi:hypothetical protein ABFS83_09G043500 [Erythranthe nasuta]